MTKDEYNKLKQSTPPVGLMEAVMTLSIYLTNLPGYDNELMERSAEEAEEWTMKTLVEKFGEEKLIEMFKTASQLHGQKEEP